MTGIICGICGGLLLFCLIIVFLWTQNNLIEISHYYVTADVERECKIVHLSDLHGKSFGVYHKRLLDKIVAQAPDVICFTGDAIHKYRDRDIQTALDVLAMCVDIAPVLYISGNHEMRNKRYRNFRAKLKSIGVTVLDNRSVRMYGLCFVGLNSAHLKNGTLKNITPIDSVKVLLAHQPQYFEKFCENGYNLVLSGHAHGGQFVIPFTKKGLYAPGQGIFPKYTCGVYTKNKTSMVVSRGLGNSQFPLRLFNRPEICVITVGSGKE